MKMVKHNGRGTLVSKVINTSSFQSIECNTNDKGRREGYIVAEKKRSTLQKKTGLNVLGFVTL